MESIASAFSGLTGKVQALDKASEQIAAILKTIEKIAAQTNLLALKRDHRSGAAGEAGKGFAVVAGEVKTLAKQTAGATEDIRGASQLLRKA
jgi:methyl-accepting chemotaxis protein